MASPRLVPADLDTPVVPPTQQKGLYRDKGKENGKCYSIIGYILGL